MVSEYDYEKERRKKEIKEAVENASGSKYCNNCFMALGLRSIAGATVRVGNKEFCNQACYSEYMEDKDDEHTVSL